MQHFYRPDDQQHQSTGGNSLTLTRENHSLAITDQSH